MTKLVESDIEFQFKESIYVIKFDETSFFINNFQRLQGSKGIDFFAYDKEKKTVYFIEVKNFMGAELENKHRLKVRTKDSLGLEVSHKVRDTLSCCVGAKRYKGEEEIAPFVDWIMNGKITLKVILFLEGTFKQHTQTLANIRDEIKSNLKWLTTKVSVESSKTTKDIVYQVSLLKRNLD